MVDVIEASQLEPTTTEEKANAQQSDGFFWGLSMLCMFVLLVFLVGAIVILTQYKKPDEGEEPARDTNNEGDNISPGPSPRPVNPVFTLTEDKSSTTAADSTSDSSGGSVSDTDQSHPPTGSTTTTTMRTKKTYTGATVKPGLLLCHTEIHRWKEVETMADGLCDLVIASEACAVSARFEDFLDHYKFYFDRSKNAVKTKYGLLSCPYDPDDFYDYYKVKDTLKAMNDSYMRHFGFTSLGRETDKMTEAAFTVSKKVINEVFGGVGTTVFIPHETNDKAYQRLASIVKRTTMIPDMFLIPGHLIKPSRNLTDRSLLPAINLYRPSTIYYRAFYGRTLADAAEESLSLVRLGLAAEIILMLTFGATTERMLYPDNLNDNLGRYAIYQPAVFPENVSKDRYFIDPRTMCNASDPEYLRNMQYQASAATWVTYNKGRRIERSYTVDTAETFRFKMCNFFVNYTTVKTKISFGIDDLDYDAFDVDCRAFKFKPYGRIKMLRAVRNFVYKDYWDPTDIFFCLRVTP